MDKVYCRSAKDHIGYDDLRFSGIELLILRENSQTVIFFNGGTFSRKDRKEFDLSLFREVDISFDEQRKEAKLVDVRYHYDELDHYMLFDNSTIVQITSHPIGYGETILQTIIKYDADSQKRSSYNSAKSSYLESDIYEDLNLEDW
ncbi:hypothetical protein PPO43_15920 [Saprospira sp. CCB-QB6]|uniref:hypothetical protein n=1 Tax=Saprospira sp. CCB-QB6 TaxID=3023936 RepID=UPI00234A7B68|nr:hypothetical protein [Saprospira sp. CCB-QB6]WCL81461.1 hypothetical protein PPO43_15920 [Saprospira sp. CCB-QB6]